MLDVVKYRLKEIEFEASALKDYVDWPCLSRRPTLAPSFRAAMFAVGH